MINYKGILQELCHKKRINIPIFKYVKLDDKPNPKWMATVSVNNLTYTATCLSKKEADQAASKIALDVFGYQDDNGVQPRAKGVVKHDELTAKSNYCCRETISTINKSLVLVDLENYPHINTPDFLNTNFINTTFFAFVGKCSSHAQKDLNAKYPFVDHFFIIDSVLPDAVDHYISMHIGSQLYQLKSDKISETEKDFVILTQDRFAGCSVDCAKVMAKNLNVREFSIRHCVSALECYEYLKSLQNI